MKTSFGLLMAGIAAFTLATCFVQADEEKVALDKLPKAVLDGVKGKFPKAELVNASKEVEDGKTFYEVTIKSDGHNIDVTLTPEGRIESIEKEIAAKDLPKTVKDTLDDKYAKAEIKKAEEITKDDKVTYEVLLTTADKKSLEVVFSPEGKVVKEEKKDKKDDK